MPSQEWLIVNDAGAIPYYSGLKTVDWGRLNDKFLIRKNLSEKEIVNYFFSYNAGAVVITSYDYEKVVNLSNGAAIVNDPRFQDYVLVKKYRPAGNSDRKYYYFVFFRKDLFDKIKQSNANK